MYRKWLILQLQNVQNTCGALTHKFRGERTIASWMPPLSRLAPIGYL